MNGNQPEYVSQKIHVQFHKVPLCDLHKYVLFMQKISTCLLQIAVLQ